MTLTLPNNLPVCPHLSLAPIFLNCYPKVSLKLHLPLLPSSFLDDHMTSQFTSKAHENSVSFVHLDMHRDAPSSPLLSSYLVLRCSLFCINPSAGILCLWQIIPSIIPSLSCNSAFSCLGVYITMFRSLLLKVTKAQSCNPLIILIHIVKFGFQIQYAILRMNFLYYKTDNTNLLKTSGYY